MSREQCNLAQTLLSCEVQIPILAHALADVECKTPLQLFSLSCLKEGRKGGSTAYPQRLSHPVLHGF
eukprot:c4594_g1_i1 orf=1-198(-)